MADKFDYVETKADADELIEEFGAAGVLLRSTPGAGPVYDPGEPTVARHDCMVAELEYSDRQIDGARIVAGDMRYLMAVGNLAIVPENTDMLEFGGVAKSIIRVRKIAPGGVTVLYDLQARKS